MKKIDYGKDYFVSEDGKVFSKKRGKTKELKPIKKGHGGYVKVRLYDDGKWVEKAASSVAEGATVVMLLPARTDTQWFHRYIYHQAEIRFVPGRLKFVGAKWNAPFPCMVVIFRPGREEQR